MDSWYAAQQLMAQIDKVGKVYYCPLKYNRRDDSPRTMPYQRIDRMHGTADELQHGNWSKCENFLWQKGEAIPVYGFYQGSQTSLPPKTCPNLLRTLCNNCARCAGRPL